MWPRASWRRATAGLNEGYVAAVPEVRLNVGGHHAHPLFVVQRGSSGASRAVVGPAHVAHGARSRRSSATTAASSSFARSGCGKTLVVQERISHIIQMSDPRQPEPRQLFIARSTPLCKQVSEKERKKNKSD